MLLNHLLGPLERIFAFQILKKFENSFFFFLSYSVYFSFEKMNIKCSIHFCKTEKRLKQLY